MTDPKGMKLRNLHRLLKVFDLSFPQRSQGQAEKILSSLENLSRLMPSPRSNPRALAELWKGGSGLLRCGWLASPRILMNTQCSSEEAGVLGGECAWLCQLTVGVRINVVTPYFLEGCFKRSGN